MYMKKILFSICMIVALSSSFANTIDDKITILASNTNGNDKPAVSSISAYINGHILTVAFSQNLGDVMVEITTASGATVHCMSVQTPTGQQFYIPAAGCYIVTFTLQNGDEYYGEFEVTD